MFISARKCKKDEMASDYSDSFVSSRHRIKRKELWRNLSFKVSINSNAAHKGTKCFLKQPRIFEDYLYYGNYNFSYYSFFLRGYKGLKVVTICYYKYLYINIYNYIFIYTFLYLHFKSVRLGQNKTVITEIVICNRFFSGIEMHTFIAPKTMTISSQSYELWPAKRWVIFFNIKL